MQERKTVALDCDGVLFVYGKGCELAHEEAQEIIDAWSRSPTGKVAGVLSNGSCYSFCYPNGEIEKKLMDEAMVDKLLGENGTYGAFMPVRAIASIKACLSILTAYGVECVPATNRLLRSLILNENGVENACEVFDLAFGKDRKFLTREQFSAIGTSELREEVMQRQPSQNEKVFMLKAICKAFCTDEQNLFFFDDTYLHLKAAYYAGYKNVQLVDVNEDGVPPIVELLIDLMKEIIPKADLEMLVAAYGNEGDLQTRRWLLSEFGFLAPYEIEFAKTIKGFCAPVVSLPKPAKMPCVTTHRLVSQVLQQRSSNMDNLLHKPRGAGLVKKARVVRCRSQQVVLEPLVTTSTTGGMLLGQGK